MQLVVDRHAPAGALEHMQKRSKIRSWLFKMAFALGMAAAGPAFGECDVIEHPGLCKSDWKTNAGFWSGTYSALATRAVMNFDGFPSVWTPEPFGAANFIAIGEPLVIETGAPLHIEARPVADELFDENTTDMRKKFDKQNVVEFSRLLHKRGTGRGEIERFWEHFLGPHANSIACGPPEKIAENLAAWHADVQTVDGMPMDLWLFAGSPVFISGVLVADTTFKGVHVKSVQGLFFFCSDCEARGKRRVKVSSEQCNKICREETWRCTK